MKKQDLNFKIPLTTRAYHPPLKNNINDNLPNIQIYQPLFVNKSAVFWRRGALIYKGGYSAGKMTDMTEK